MYVCFVSSVHSRGTRSWGLLFWFLFPFFLFFLFFLKVHSLVNEFRAIFVSWCLVSLLFLPSCYFSFLSFYLFMLFLWAAFFAPWIPGFFRCGPSPCVLRCSAWLPQRSGCPADCPAPELSVLFNPSSPAEAFKVTRLTPLSMILRSGIPPEAKWWRFNS